MLPHLVLVLYAPISHASSFLFVDFPPMVMVFSTFLLSIISAAPRLFVTRRGIILIMGCGWRYIIPFHGIFKSFESQWPSDPFLLAGTETLSLCVGVALNRPHGICTPFFVLLWNDRNLLFHSKAIIIGLYY